MGSGVNINVIRASANYSSNNTQASGLTDKYSFFQSYREVQAYESEDKKGSHITKLEKVKFLLDQDKKRREAMKQEEEEAKNFEESVPRPSVKEERADEEIIQAKPQSGNESDEEQVKNAEAPKKNRQSTSSKASGMTTSSKRIKNYSSKRSSKRKIGKRNSRQSRSSRASKDNIENNFSSQKMPIEIASNSELTLEEGTQQPTQNEQFDLSEQLVNLRLSKQVDPDVAAKKNSFIVGKKNDKPSNFNKGKPEVKIGYPEDSQNIDDVIGADYQIQEKFAGPERGEAEVEANKGTAAPIQENGESEPTTESGIRRFAHEYVSNIKTEIINQNELEPDSNQESQAKPESRNIAKSPGPRDKSAKRKVKVWNRLNKRNKTKEKIARENRLRRLNASKSRGKRYKDLSKSNKKKKKTKNGVENAHIPMNAYKRNREKSSNIISTKKSNKRFPKEVTSPANKNDFYEKMLNPKDPNALPETPTPPQKPKKLSGKVKNTVNRLYKIKPNSRAARGEVQKDSLMGGSRNSSARKPRSIGSLPPNQKRPKPSDPKKLWKDPNMKQASSKVKEMIKSKKRRERYWDEKANQIDEKLRVLEEERKRVAALQFEMNRLKFLIEKEDKMKTMRDPEQEKKDMEDRWKLRQKLKQAQAEARKAEKEFIKKIRDDGWDDLRGYKKKTKEDALKSMRDKVQDVKIIYS